MSFKQAILAGTLSLVPGAAWADSPTLRADQAAGTPEQIAKGKGLFMGCVGCHGMDGEGKVGVAPALNSNSYLAVVSNEFLAVTVRDGRTGTNMIAWGAMYKDEDVDALVAYMRDWQTVDSLPLETGPLTGDATQGKQLYADICARCHGRSGAGFSELGSGSGIGRAAFLAQADDATLRGIIKNGKDNTAMRSFSADSPVAVANLTDTQIDSIIQYLRANAW